MNPITMAFFCKGEDYLSENQKTKAKRTFNLIFIYFLLAFQNMGIGGMISYTCRMKRQERRASDGTIYD